MAFREYLFLTRKRKKKRTIEFQRMQIKEYFKKTENYQIIFSYFIRLTLIIAMASAAYNGRWTILFASTSAFVLTFSPSIIEKNFKIHLPPEFEFVIVLFVYASLFLGEVHDYYTRFWWWDVVLHTGSGIVFGIIGFLILYLLHREHKIVARPLTIAIFSFCFGLAIGSLWEIFEFGMDSLFGFTMQKSGIKDTMWDLIVDSIGALLASLIGYLYMKGRLKLVSERMIHPFVISNPKLYGKKRR